MQRTRETLAMVMRQQFLITTFLMISTIMLAVLMCQIIDLLEALQPGLIILKALLGGTDEQKFHERLNLLQYLAFRGQRNFTF